MEKVIDGKRYSTETSFNVLTAKLDLASYYGDPSSPIYELSIYRKNTGEYFLAEKEYEYNFSKLRYVGGKIIPQTSREEAFATFSEKFKKSQTEERPITGNERGGGYVIEYNVWESYIDEDFDFDVLFDIDVFLEKVKFDEDALTSKKQVKSVRLPQVLIDFVNEIGEKNNLNFSETLTLIVSKERQNERLREIENIEEFIGEEL